MTRRRRVVAQDDILEQVRAAVASTLKVEAERVTLEARLIEDLGGDSLDMLELIMNLEERFGMEVPDEDTEYIRTVRDIVTYVSKHRVAKT
jgi:acyl carrier protein